MAERAAILMYHRVAALEPDPFGLCTPPAIFAEHLARLRSDFTPLPLDELARAAAAGRLPPRAVAVTLDDGYLDQLTAASELLVAHGVPATFFVNTARLDEPHEFWWDTLERVLLGPHPLPPELELGAELYATGSELERRATFRALHTRALELDAGARDAIVDAVVARCSVEPAPRASHRAMTGAEVVLLAARPGCSIGAHTAHHLHLPSQPRAVQEQEIAGGKAELERALGQPVASFSYPFGAHDPAIVELARAAGFATAVTVEERLVEPGDDPLALPRLEAGAVSGAALAARLELLFGAPA